MKQFNLDEYIKNPSRQVVTRDGRNVKILCTDYIGFGPIIAKVEGNSYSQMFYSDGRACRCEESTYDLFFVTEKHEGWINVYRDRDTGATSFGAILYTSREEAEDVGKTDVYYTATAKIEWEE